MHFDSSQLRAYAVLFLSPFVVVFFLKWTFCCYVEEMWMESNQKLRLDKCEFHCDMIVDFIKRAEPGARSDHCTKDLVSLTNTNGIRLSFSLEKLDFLYILQFADHEYLI